MYFIETSTVKMSNNDMPGDEIFRVILNLCPGKGWTLDDIKARYVKEYCAKHAIYIILMVSLCCSFNGMVKYG